jgi:hypothetical protein
MGLYWRIEKKIRELESASGSVAGATGAIYCARRALLEPLPEGTILDDVLLPMQVVRKGSRVVFDSRARAWDSTRPGPQAASSPAKCGPSAATISCCNLRRGCLSVERTAIRFEFISHKLLRLVVPFALLALLVRVSVLAAARLYAMALVAQIIFYGLSLAAMAGSRSARCRASPTRRALSSC